MKLRPLMFSEAMVHAIMRPEHPKCETRRLRGLNVVNEHPDEWHLHTTAIVDDRIVAHFVNIKGGESCMVRAFYGKPGDGFYVQEKHRLNEAGEVWYAADDPRPERWKWRPAMFLSATQARITRVITSLRLERIQELTDDGAIREGIQLHERTCTMYHGIYRDRFVGLWTTINGPGAWDRNPWVWVIAFAPVTT